MMEPKLRERQRHSPRFISIGRQWFAGGDIAEAAGAGADVPQDHNCQGTAIPAFADIWAASTFANGMKAKLMNQRPHIHEILPGWHFDFEPGRMAPGEIGWGCANHRQMMYR